MSDKAPDYGKEPWEFDGKYIYDSRGIPLLRIHPGAACGDDVAPRAVASVNACVGVPDPSPGELGELREQVSQLARLLREGKELMSDYAASLATERAARERAEATAATLQEENARGHENIRLLLNSDAAIYRLLVQHFGSNLRGAQQGLHESLSAVVNIQRDRAEKAESDVARLRGLLQRATVVLDVDDRTHFADVIRRELGE